MSGQFVHHDLGHRRGGEIVEITLSGNSANVRLMDSSNVSNYRLVNLGPDRIAGTSDDRDQSAFIKGAAVGADIIKRPYITIGMLALLLLVPLAITSTNRMMRRLGRRWQKLHMLVYLVALLGVWHYWWQVKKDIREPLLYFAIFGVLMAFRAYRAFRAKSAPATAPGRT